MPVSVQKQVLQSSADLNVDPGTHSCSGASAAVSRLVLVLKQNFCVQAAIPVAVQKQSLHPSALLKLVPGSHSFFGGAGWATWRLGFVRNSLAERLSRGGQALRVQNHPMPLAAHLHRLQSSIFTSFGVHTCPLVCTSSSSFSAAAAALASGCKLSLTSSTIGCAFGSSPCTSGTQNFLVQDITLPSAPQRHVLQSSLNVLPGSHCLPASKDSAPATSTAAINSNDLMVPLQLLQIVLLASGHLLTYPNETPPRRFAIHRPCFTVALGKLSTTDKIAHRENASAARFRVPLVY